MKITRSIQTPAAKPLETHERSAIATGSKTFAQALEKAAAEPSTGPAVSPGVGGTPGRGAAVDPRIGSIADRLGAAVEPKLTDTSTVQEGMAARLGSLGVALPDKGGSGIEALTDQMGAITGRELTRPGSKFGVDLTPSASAPKQPLGPSTIMAGDTVHVTEKTSDQESSDGTRQITRELTVVNETTGETFVEKSSVTTDASGETTTTQDITVTQSDGTEEHETSTETDSASTPPEGEGTASNSTATDPQTTAQTQLEPGSSERNRELWAEFKPMPESQPLADPRETMPNPEQTTGTYTGTVPWVDSEMTGLKGDNFVDGTTSGGTAAQREAFAEKLEDFDPVKDGGDYDPNPEKS